MSPQKRIRVLQDRYPDWDIERGSKHLKLTHRATGKIVFTGSTPRSEIDADGLLRRKLRRVLGGIEAR
jgi:hypothetical protein